MASMVRYVLHSLILHRGAGLQGSRACRGQRKRELRHLTGY